MRVRVATLLHLVAAASAQFFAGLRSHFGGGGSALRAVPLLRKPTDPTGRITIAEEGLAVLRAQREPFGIVAAVGPTRTGKSTILGRAYLRGKDENVFEIGGGVTSHTTGAHITSGPIAILPGGLPIFLIDTEGFSGIGGRTSRTYEANLFGIVSLMASVLIFNTAFPVDASTVHMLGRFASHALAVLTELNRHATAVSRRPPALVWVVQNFNLHNLANSHMTVDELHEALHASSTSSTAGELPPAAAQLLGRAGKGMRRGLLGSLFASQHLHPVRRPHPSDEVVANLAKHSSSELTKEYLSDAAKLKELSRATHSAQTPRCTPCIQCTTELAALCVRQELTARLVLPSHVCQGNVTAAAARTCEPSPLNGAAYVRLLQRWVSAGHITVDEDEGRRPKLNATALIATYASQLESWTKWKCNEVRQLLEKNARKLGGKGCPVKGCPRISAKLNEKLQGLTKASIQHMVDRKEVERQSPPSHAYTARRSRDPAPLWPWAAADASPPAALLRAPVLDAARPRGDPHGERERTGGAGVPRGDRELREEARAPPQPQPDAPRGPGSRGGSGRGGEGRGRGEGGGGGEGLRRCKGRWGGRGRRPALD